MDSIQCKRIIAYSHVGNSRETQEDNFVINNTIYLSPLMRREIEFERRLFIIDRSDVPLAFCAAISDGMGGHDFGEVASLESVKYLSEHHETLLKSVKMGKDVIIEFFSTLNQEFCNYVIHNMPDSDMGATLCGIVSDGTEAYCFNVGDSRMCQYTQGVLTQISVDNSEGQRILDLGLLTNEELLSFPKRKAIYKYIGKKAQLIPDIYKLKSPEPGTIWMLFSDGLSDVVEAFEIEEVLSKDCLSLLEKGQLLVEKAIERNEGEGDNVSLILFEF